MARNTDLRIQIEATAAQAEREIAKLERSFRQTENAMWRAEEAARQLDKQLEQETAANARKAAEAQEKLGRGLVAFGAATLAGLGLATKAAMDWESAWAGVMKTVDGSPEQMAALEAELRQLAQTLPASHQEIAAVAEAAGQLGVQREAVAAFTRVMIDLGETTNLTADEAATAIAQLGNVLGFDLKEDVDNFGAALVALGNDGASTEAEILQLAQRIGGAGSVIGLSADQVLGFAAAIANVGISAEAGGSSISKVMIEIADSVASGNEKLATFAEVAGMTSAEFTQAFEEDPARAIGTFIAGLGAITDAGGNTFAVLDDLGLSEIRVRDALLRLSQSTRGVATDLDLASQAWSDNTALIEEAEKRYETTEAKVQIAKNTLVDLAIDIGSVILPGVAQLAESAADLIRWFSDIPGPVQTALTILAGVVGVVSLLAGGLLLLAPRLLATQQLFASVAATSPLMASGISAATTAAKAFGVAVAGLTTAVTVWQLLKMGVEDFSVGAGEAALALAELEEGTSNQLIGRLGELHTQLDAADRILGVIPTSISGMTMSGKEAEEVNKEWAASIEAVDQVLATMVGRGDLDGAAEKVKLLGTELGLSGEELKAFVNEHLPLYADGLAGVEAASREGTEGVDEFKDGVAGIAPVIEEADPFLVALGLRFGAASDEAEESAGKILESWSKGFQEFVGLVDVYNEALSAKEEAERNAAQATADSTEDATDSWEDFYTDVQLTFDEYLTALEEQVKAQEEWATNMTILAARGVDDGVLAKLAEMGPAGAQLVADAAKASDEELRKLEELFDRSGSNSGDNFARQLATAGPLWAAIAKEEGQDTADELTAALAAGEITWTEILNRYGDLLDDSVPPTKGTDVQVTGEGPAIGKLGAFKSALDAIMDKTVTLTAQTSLGGSRWSPTMMATGGAVYGAGTETSDSIPALLSNNEHVWTAAEVRGAGGHGAVLRLRDLARDGQIPAFARGGAVGNSLTLRMDSSGMESGTFWRRAFGGFIERITDSIRRAMSPLGFAMSQAGKPYHWGGVGPAGYDCSGFMSAIVNFIQGRPPYARRFATGNFPTGDFARGPGRFSIGSFRGNPGHMAGTLLGVNVESRGGEGVVVGPRARGARHGLFGGNVWHLKGFAQGGAVEGDPPFDTIDPRGLHVFDRGGRLMPGQLGVNLSGSPETVLSPRTSAMFDRLVTAIEGGRFQRQGYHGGIGPSVTATGAGGGQVSLTVVAPQAETVAAVRRELNYWADATQTVGV